MPATAATIDAEHLQRLAEKLARKVWHPGGTIDLEDLVQEGVIGGLKALDRYDPARGVRLSTYLYKVVFGAVLDVFRRPGATLVRTPRNADRILVSGDTGELSLAELAIDRGGLHATETPAPPDTSTLSRQQRRLIRLLYHKRLSREEAAAKLKVSLERLDELEHETALTLRSSTQDVQSFEREELDMIALANHREAATTEPEREICETCNTPMWRNHRCRNTACSNYDHGNGRKAGKAKGKRASVAVTPSLTPAPPPAPAPAPTVGPAELTALADITRVMVTLSAASRVAVVAWVVDVFGVGV